MVDFYWSLIDSKSPQVSRTFLSILILVVLSLDYLGSSFDLQFTQSLFQTH